MVQECLEVETNQDIIWESIARALREVDQRFERDRIRGGRAQEKAWRSGCQGGTAQDFDVVELNLPIQIALLERYRYF